MVVAHKSRCVTPHIIERGFLECKTLAAVPRVVETSIKMLVLLSLHFGALDFVIGP